jgi:DNA invertase Pin-like site-specific DNA recombinase
MDNCQFKGNSTRLFQGNDNAFIQTSDVFAELELRIIRERVRFGMANAEAKGAKIGRPQTAVDN